MDGLAELIPLLLVGAYYLLQGRRRAAQRRAQTVAPGVEPSASGTREVADAAPTPFQSFVQQIEDAMAEASGETRAHPDPTPEPPPAIAPPPRTRTPEFRAPKGSFVSTAPSDHAAHGFGDANPFSEEAFERMPSGGLTPRGRAPAYDPHGLKRSDPPPRHPETWRTILRDPKAARDAFVLQTVFGPRGGRRNDPR